MPTPRRAFRVSAGGKVATLPGRGVPPPRSGRSLAANRPGDQLPHRLSHHFVHPPAVVSVTASRPLRRSACKTACRTTRFGDSTQAEPTKTGLSGAFLERMMGLEPTTFCMATRPRRSPGCRLGSTSCWREEATFLPRRVEARARALARLCAGERDAVEVLQGLLRRVRPTRVPATL
jgi:hypothetical protein